MNDWTIDDIIVLHSSERYITFIALENCIEYFLMVGCIGNNTKPKITRGQELKIFRAYLNAIESLNNIIEYVYFDKFCKNISFFDFQTRMLKEYNILQNVHDIANAYKHCIRGTWQNKIFYKNTKSKSAKDITVDHKIIMEAYQFWHQYINDTTTISI